MKALSTNANGLPRPAALLGALVGLALGALEPEVEPPEVVAEEDVVAVEVRVAMLMVVLRLMGMPVPALAEAPAPIPVPTIPVPTMAVVVAL
jgi:hypothetical protein